VSVSLSHVDGPGDAELIAAVRGGDLDSYGELYARHVDAARRLARQLTSPADADDLVSDAFTKVLTVLQRGGGPDLAFRAYLLTAVRRLHVDRLRSGSRLRPVDDLTPFDPGLPFHDTAVEGFDNAAAAKAFASLPERWQMVLWHTEVEGQKPADIAPLLGMSANSVAALAYRAREGLRQAFLSQHAADMDDVDCAWTRDHLGAYVRGGLSRRDAGRVDDHLAECRACAAVYLELTEVNSGLAGLLAPLLLGAAGVGYLSSAHGGVAAGAAVGGGLAGAKAWVSTHAALTAVGGVAVTATALLAVYGVSQLNGNQPAEAGAHPTLHAPGSSVTNGGQSPDGRGPTPRHHASQTPSVSLRNQTPATVPAGAPTTTTTTAAAPATQPSDQPTDQSSSPADNPTSQPTSPSTTPTSPTTTPTSPSTSPPPADVAFTSTPPAKPVIGSTYVVQASGGSGSIAFSVDPATSHAGTAQAACSIAGNTVTFDHAGTCVIAADQTAKRAATHATQRIDIPQIVQTVAITSSAPADAAVDGTYVVRTDPDVSVTLSTNAACSVSGTTVTFDHAVPCVVTATLPGDLDHTTATDVQTVDPVAKGTQTITLVPTTPTIATVGDTYTFAATGGSSGNAVAVTTTTPEVCAVTNTSVTFLNPGSCNVSAAQDGSADYDPASFATSVHVVPPAEADLALTATKIKEIGGLSGVAATVTGLPAGTSATLTAHATGDAAFRKDPSDTACTDIGDRTWRCTVTPGDTVFSFAVNTQQGRTVTFTVTPDAPLTDPNPDNNTAWVRWE
jgi:RNA polymerase sigma factor (sigma-70 family)